MIRVNFVLGDDSLFLMVLTVNEKEIYAYVV